jgi:hypothetical protein
MHQAQLPADQVEGKHGEQENAKELQAHLIQAVPVPDMRQFVAENLSARLGVHGQLTVPEDPVEERKGCSRSIRLEKGHPFHPGTDGLSAKATQGPNAQQEAPQHQQHHGRIGAKDQAFPRERRPGGRGGAGFAECAFYRSLRYVQQQDVLMRLGLERKGNRYVHEGDHHGQDRRAQQVGTVPTEGLLVAQEEMEIGVQHSGQEQRFSEIQGE